jgi:hypothetical protein
MMKKLRLVRVVVQPEFVVDDGENLTPFTEGDAALTAVVTAKAWPDYPTTGFADAVKKLESDLNAETEDD